MAATDHNDHLAGFSNYGPTSVDLAAPGVDILSTMPGGGYGILSGTSMATPHVAGVAALVRDLHPTWSYQQINDMLLATVDPIAALDGITVTGGRLNAAAAATGTPPPDTTGPRVNPAPRPASSRRRQQPPRGIQRGGRQLRRDRHRQLHRPGRINPILSVLPVDGSNGRQFDVTFASQAAEGTYTMVIGPGDLQDSSGNEMDQDRDGNQGEDR